MERREFSFWPIGAPHEILFALYFDQEPGGEVWISIENTSKEVINSFSRDTRNISGIQDRALSSLRLFDRNAAINYNDVRAANDASEETIFSGRWVRRL